MADYVSLLVLAIILMLFVAPAYWNVVKMESEDYPATYPQEIYIKTVSDDGSPSPMPRSTST